MLNQKEQIKFLSEILLNSKEETLDPTSYRKIEWLVAGMRMEEYKCLNSIIGTIIGIYNKYINQSDPKKYLYKETLITFINKSIHIQIVAAIKIKEDNLYDKYAKDIINNMKNTVINNNNVPLDNIYDNFVQELNKLIKRTEAIFVKHMLAILDSNLKYCQKEKTILCDTVISDFDLQSNEVGLEYTTFIEFYEDDIITQLCKRSEITQEEAKQICQKEKSEDSEPKKTYDIIKYMVKTQTYEVIVDGEVKKVAYVTDYCVSGKTLFIPMFMAISVDNIKSGNLGTKQIELKPVNRKKKI